MEEGEKEKEAGSKRQINTTITRRIGFPLGVPWQAQWGPGSRVPCYRNGAEEISRLTPLISFSIDYAGDSMGSAFSVLFGGIFEVEKGWRT